MILKNDFVPCKECIECGLDLYEGEPYYYCKLQKGVMYWSFKEMIRECPVRTPLSLVK